MRRVGKLLALPLPVQRDLAEAVFCLGVARLFLFLPFRWLVRLIGQPLAAANDSATALETDENSMATAVRYAILRVAERLPWESSCLVRALGALIMLRRRRLPSVLLLGIRSGTATELAAHAWLQCGEVDVIGVESAAEFTPIAVFHA